jgi:hypothetical protein
VRLPRDLNGRELAVLLDRHYGYKIARQSGSDLRLVTAVAGEQRVTVPAGSGDRMLLRRPSFMAPIIMAEGAGPRRLWTNVPPAEYGGTNRCHSRDGHPSASNTAIGSR